MGVCLAVTIPLLLVTYASETAPAGQRVAVIVGGSLASVGLAIALILAYAGIRWAYARCRRPWAWVAIRVLDAASMTNYPSVPALGIADRNGDLAISLPFGGSGFIAEGDAVLALNVHTKEILGALNVASVERDSCLCIVTNITESPDFWAGLEERVRRDFSPPIGVEFSRPINQDSIDLARRIIRRWGEQK